MKIILSVFMLLFLYSNEALSHGNNCDFNKVSQVINVYKKFKHNKKINKFFTKTIIKYGNKYKVDCVLMATIIKVESDFVHKKNSITPEDISIAQINYPLQKRNLKRLGVKLNKKKLISSNKYAIEMMAMILSLLKKDYAKKDPLWYARYNTGKYLYKLEYLHRLEFQWKKVGLADYFVNYKEKKRLLRHCVMKYGWKRVVNIYTRLSNKQNEMKAYKQRFSK